MHHTLKNYIVVAVLICGFGMIASAQAANSITLGVSVTFKRVYPPPQTNIEMAKVTAMQDGNLNALDVVVPSVGGGHVQINFKKTIRKTPTGTDNVLEVTSDFI